MSITSDTIRHKNSFVNYRRIYPAFVKTMASACHYIVHFGRILAAGNWKSAAKVLTMEDNFAIQLFEGKKVRIVWDEEKEKYWFSVVDIVQVLTDSADAKQYIKRMRARDSELNSKWGTICTPVEMRAFDGKRRKVQAADLQGVFRIIQSVPSKKAELKRIFATT